MTPQDHIAELQNALEQRERRLQELKADLDKANDLIRRQDKHVRACAETIEVWKAAFEMKLRADGVWVWNESVVAGDKWHDRYIGLVRKWNRNVADFNATMVRRRNVGRPLAASDAQQQTVTKLRAAGKSLRAIARQTGLGLTTVRTILDQRHRRDRASLKPLERIGQDMVEERAWRFRRRTRRSLPRQINALRQQGDELRNEAKGLK
jgi:DNA-binding CsgD family transcriptional regulator